MAEEAKAEPAAAEKKPAAKSGGMMKMILIPVMALVVIGASAGTAAVVGKVMSAPPNAKQTPTTGEGSSATTAEESGSLENFTYYDFEPIVVNLDEPRLARYVRATVTLALKGDKDEIKLAKEQIETRKPELKSWLTVYLSGCTLDDMRGRRNLTRIAREIEEALNDQLWRNSKPMVHHVLFKEIAVQ